jgi:hypothetical protein
MDKNKPQSKKGESSVHHFNHIGMAANKFSVHLS